MANVTGEAVDQVSSYMTAIWNNFNKAGDESAEHYGDIMTLLGAETAASSEEIAGGLEKFASIGDTIGLSFDYAASAVTTIVDRTRESEDTVGNALKTIFSRMESLKLGETLEDGTDLNKYSKALKTVGIDIKDATGELKDMDQIIDEVGGKWGELGRNERVALAQTVAGTMQYTRFMALFDNFDFFQDMVDLSGKAEGTMEEQNEIYAESWEAASNRIRSAFEGMWQDLIDDKFFIELTNNISTVVESFGSIIDSAGGLKTVLLSLSGIMLKLFNKNISESLKTVGTNLFFATKGGRDYAQEIKSKSAHSLADRYENSGNTIDQFSAKLYQKDADLLDKLYKKTEELKKAKKEVNEEEVEHVENLRKSLIEINEQATASMRQARELKEQRESNTKGLKQQALISANRQQEQDKNNPNAKQRPLYAPVYQNNGTLEPMLFGRRVNNNLVKTPEGQANAYERDLKHLQNQYATFGAYDSLGSKISGANQLGAIKTKAQSQDAKLQEEAKKDLEALKRVIKTTQEELDKAGYSTENFTKKTKKAIAGLGEMTLDNFEQKIKDFVRQMEKESGRVDRIAGNVAETAARSTGMRENGVRHEIVRNGNRENMASRSIEEGEEIVNAAYQQNTGEEIVRKANEEMDNFKGKTYSLGEAAVSAAESFGMVTASVELFKNMVETIEDPTSSFIDKMSVMGITASMMVPSFTSLISTFKAIRGLDISEMAAKIAGMRGLGSVKVEAAKAEKGLKSLKIALEGFGPHALIFAGIAAAIGLTVAALYQLDKKSKEARNQFQDLQEASETASKSLQKTTNSIGNLTNSVEKINDKRQTLKDMESGTASWRKEVNELNGDIIKSVQNYNKLNNKLSTKSKATALNEAKNQAKETGLDPDQIRDTKLEEGKDYYYDSEGVLNYTDTGKIKIESVGAIMVEEATIQANNAKMAEEAASIGANSEELFGNWSNTASKLIDNFFGLKDADNVYTSKSYKHSDEYADKYNATEDQFSKKAYDSIMQGLQNEEIQTSYFGDKNYTETLENYLRNTTNLSETQIQKQVDLIQTDNDLIETLKAHAQVIIDSTESIQSYGKDSIMNDSNLDDYLKNKMSKDDYDEYSSYIKQMMGEDYADTYKERVTDYQQNKDDKKWMEKNVWGEGKNWKDYKQEFLNSDLGSSYTKNEDGDIVDSEGNEIDKDKLETMVTYYKLQKNSMDDVLDVQGEYLKQLEDIKKAEEGYKTAKGIWDEQADSLKEANKVMKDAIDKHGSFNKVLSEGDKTSKAAAKSFNDFANSVRKSMGDILGMDLDDSIFNGEFVQKNFDTIEDAFTGDADAIEKLQDAYSVERMSQNADIAIKINPELDGYSLDEFKNLLQTRLNNLQDSLEGVKIGTEIDQESFDNANAYMANYVGTAEDLIDELNDQGLDVDIDDIVAEGAVVSGTATGTNYKAVDGPELKNYEFNASATSDATADMIGETIEGETTNKANPIIQGVKGVWTSTDSGQKVQNVAVEASDPIKITDKNKDQTFTSWKFKKTKAAGSGIHRAAPRKLPPPQTKNPSDTGKERSKTPPSSGSRRTSPRRSGSRTRARARDRKTHTSKYTRYKEIDDTMSRLSKATERQVKLEDQLYGKKKLDAMKQVNKNLQAELKAIQKKRKEARAYSIIDKNNLQKDLKEAEKNVADAIKKLNKENKNKKSAKLKFTPITDFTFNKYGEITNYTKIMKGIDAQLKSLYKTYNKIKNGDVQSTFYEKRIQPLEEAMSQIEAAVKQYDETRELMIELQEEWNEKYLELLDKNFENLTYQVELKLELTEGSKKLIDYFASKLESDAYKIGELFSYTFTKTYENINDSVAAYTDKNYQLPEGGDKLTYLENIQKQYERGTITQAKYVEGLKEERDALLEQAQSYIELNNKMSNWYEDSLSKVQEELNRYTQNIEQAVSAMEHMKNVLDLSGESKDYNKLLNYQNRIVGLAQQQYEISLKNYEARQNELKILDDEAKKSTYNEDQQKEYEKQRQNLINQINQAGEEVLSNYETILQGAQTLLETQLEKANKAIDDFLSDTVGGFDELLDQMDRTSNRQDEYLTKTNQIYEMNKMLRTLRQDMDKSDNKAAKQRMKNFENELTSLKEKGELSQLELQIAQARYEQLKAQIALEEAQNAKQTVRLRRDNEGNYGYVYTANEDQINDAEQSLDDANNNLYNIYLEASNNYNQKIIDQTQSLLSKLQDIENSDLSKEEKQQLRETAIAQYKELINTSAKLAEIGQNGLKIDFGASGEDWVSKYTGPVQKILGNLDGSLKEYLEKIDSANEDYQKIYDKYFEQTNKIAENIYNTSQNSWKKLMGEDGDSGILRKLNNEMLEQVKKVSAWLEKLATILAKIGNLEDLLKDLNKDITAENTGENAIASNTNYNQLLSDIATNGYNGKITSTDFSKDNDSARVFTDSKGNVMSFNSVAKAMKKNSKIQAYNEKVAKTLIEEKTKGTHGLLGYNSDGELVYVTTNSPMTDSTVKKLKDQLAKKIGGSEKLQKIKSAESYLNKYWSEQSKKPKTSKGRTNRKENMKKYKKAYENIIKDVISSKNQKKYLFGKSLTKEEKKKILSRLSKRESAERNNYWKKSNHEFVQFKTGGYTGDWGGQNGKLAMLHQKEIVLNKDDTKNLLASVDVIRGIVSSIDLQALSRQYGSNVSSQNLTNFNGNNLQQDVRISAEFPNVRDRNEIEAAFDNLVNRAAQYANRRV